MGSLCGAVVSILHHSRYSTGALSAAVVPILDLSRSKALSLHESMANTAQVVSSQGCDRRWITDYVWGVIKRLKRVPHSFTKSRLALISKLEARIPHKIIGSHPVGRSQDRILQKIIGSDPLEGKTRDRNPSANHWSAVLSPWRWLQIMKRSCK